MTGWLLIAAGVLLVGFVIMLIRVGPGLADTLQHLDEPMGGFIFMLILVNLAVFPVVGLVGAAATGLGLLLGYVGTATSRSGPAAPA